MAGYTTLVEALSKVGEDYPHTGFTFQDLKGRETHWSYPRIVDETGRRAGALQAMGIRKGDRVALAIIEPETFVLSFLACIRMGAWPVPLYPPLSMGALDAYADKTARILDASKARLLIVSSKLSMLMWGQVDRVPSLEKVVTATDLGKSQESLKIEEITPEDVAFLQFTSGSTALPKGVMVTHASLRANAHVNGIDGLKMRPGIDPAMAWLPLYHDMGLIGFVISSLMIGIPTILMPPVRFLLKPAAWIETLHRHKATATFAPNFALALTARRTKVEQAREWDLSNLKVVGCGAEPIQPDTLISFADFFAEHSRFDPGALMPAYGMAEATLSMALHPRGEGLVTRHVDQALFENDGVVQISDGDNTVEHVDCGPAIPHGHAFRIIDDAGHELPEGRQGQICFSGPSVTKGYYDNPEATAEAYRDGWLHTGDLGYLLDGHIFVTGRMKDLIIFNGRNIHPQVIEWAAAEVDGVRKGNVVAFSRQGAASEELVLVAETRGEVDEALVKAVKQAVQAEAGAPLADVVFVPKGTLPKTSSGKLQRRETQARYHSGTLGQGSRMPGAKAGKVTVARHLAKGVFSRAKAALKSED